MSDAAPPLDVPQLKKLLSKAKSGSVSCAVGRIGDGSEGQTILMLHRSRKPLGLKEELLKTNPEAKTVRFGTISIDRASNPRLVKFDLNKQAPGLAKRLTGVMRSCGYGKAEIENS